jgi:hypothetical protein
MIALDSIFEIFIQLPLLLLSSLLRTRFNLINVLVCSISGFYAIELKRLEPRCIQRQKEIYSKSSRKKNSSHNTKR